MAVNSKLRSFYHGLFDGLENFSANNIMKIQEWRYLLKYTNRKNKLTREQKKQIRQYWKKYTHISPLWAKYYTGNGNDFDPRYIPNTLIYGKIDKYFNNKQLAWGMCDKNYYSKLFAGFLQPECIVRKIGDILYDENYRLISEKQALELVKSERKFIYKPTLETGSGRGIEFVDQKIDSDDKLKQLINSTGNYTIQKIIQQHEDLKKIHKESVNTIRITSLIIDSEVYILSSVLRMGVDKSNVDNATAGGITCGIMPDGTLRDYATSYYAGKKIYKHPQGFVFKGFKVPSYLRSVAMVKEMHSIIGHFKLASWDIAVREDGEPILIEVNLRKGSINFHQFNNGPLFGDLTDKVLDEVFARK